MSAHISEVKTDGRGGLRGEAEGTTRPYLKAAPPIPLHIALHSERMKKLNHLSWNLT